LDGELNSAINRIELLSALFEGVGNLVLSIGNKEIKLQENDFLKNFTTDATAILGDFAKSLTAEELGTLMKLLIELTNHMQNLTDLFQLEPDKKIIVGNEILELSQKSTVLAEGLRKRSEG
jgi:hypothetical protein